MMRIFLFLFIAAVCSCINSTSNRDGLVSDQLMPPNYQTNIALVNGKYVIDTNAVLNNNNLISLIESIEKTDLEEKRTVAEIPVFIMSFLNTLTDSFSIADPGKDWQACCVSIAMADKEAVLIGDVKPKRQLIYFGMSSEVALMAYYSGGIGVTGHILIFRFKDNDILDFWCGTSLADLTTAADIVNYLEANKDKEWGLNTNIIFL